MLYHRLLKILEQRERVGGVGIFSGEVVVAHAEHHYALNQGQKTGYGTARQQAADEEDDAGGGLAEVEVLNTYRAEEDGEKGGHATAFAGGTFGKHVVLTEIYVGVETVSAVGRLVVTVILIVVLAVVVGRLVVIHWSRKLLGSWVLLLENL